MNNFFVPHQVHIAKQRKLRFVPESKRKVPRNSKRCRVPAGCSKLCILLLPVYTDYTESHCQWICAHARVWNERGELGVVCESNFLIFRDIIICVCFRTNLVMNQSSRLRSGNHIFLLAVSSLSGRLNSSQCF